jgi:uncharacterized membrane protein
MSPRLLAIDWMRGFVMLLMALDHASATFNGGRVAADSAYAIDLATGAPAWEPGAALPLAQFLTRWVTHLCAPTFLFLSGTSLALSLERRARAGAGAAELDRHLLVRGLVILGFEGLLSLLGGSLVLQVLYAIGVALLLMIPLRRLPARWLASGALAWIAGGELLTPAPGGPRAGAVGLAAALALVPRFGAGPTVLYPALPWLAQLALGFAFGRHLLGCPPGREGRLRAARLLAGAGLAALVLFAAVRGLDGYGNMGLHRDDGSLVQWLHVSKYPPSLSFAALELGLMGLCLGGLLLLEGRRARPPWRGSPVLVFGQTALFFYVLHLPLLGAAATFLTGGIGRRGLPEAYAAAALALLALYPVCRLYRAWKSAHPRGLAQYL